MMRALYSGVAGLKTHQVKMDVIGNNIANVNTTAFKSQSIVFSDFLYQTTQAASGANANTGRGGTNARQIGLGAKSGAISTAITSQGSAQTTNNPFDIMITGESFFVVNNGQNNFFTRDGSFRVDAAGNLVMASTGYTLMGWQADEEGNIIADTVSPLRVMSPDKMTYPPEATSKGMISGILDKNDTNVHSASGKIISMAMYDNLGYKYNARFSVHSSDAVKGEYYILLDDITDADGKSANVSAKFGGKIDVKDSRSYKALASDYKLVKDGNKCSIYNAADVDDDGVPLTGKTALFDTTTEKDYETNSADVVKLLTCYGQLDTYVDTANSKLNEPYKTVTVKFDENTGMIDVSYTKTVDNAARLKYDTDSGLFSGVGAVNDYASLTEDNATMELTFSTENFSPITIDFSTSTMYNNGGTSTIGGTNGDAEGYGSGRKLGEMSGLSVSKEGIISASYDNGQLRILGQIAVAQFANAAGLEKSGDNLYSQTMNSGEFDGIGVDISAGGGYMSTGVLEMSNVDLSGEFTDMITTQRGFQANSRIISVSDSILEELVNLKR